MAQFDLTDQRRPWLSWTPSLAAPFRLVCFPHAGAAASSYRSWVAPLEPYVNVVAPQLPGRETRIAESPIDDLDHLVQATIDGIGPLLEPPYALFGHSFGALLAFEACRRLAAIDGPLPVALFVSGFRHPSFRSAHGVCTSSPMTTCWKKPAPTTARPRPCSPITN